MRKVLDEGVLNAGEGTCFWTDAYFATPEDMEQLAAKHGTILVDHVATDGISHTIHTHIDALTPEQFDAYLHYHYETCREPSLLGMSTHGLLVCRKPTTTQ